MVGDAMITLDELVERCLAASRGPGGAEDVREVLRSLISHPDQLELALGPVTAAGETTLFSSPEVTVARLVWGPGMVMYPHDHRMWTAIGVYRGVERNLLHRARRTGSATPACWRSAPATWCCSVRTPSFGGQPGRRPERRAPRLRWRLRP